MSDVLVARAYLFRRDFISVALLVAGCVNGFVTQITETLYSQGLKSAFQLFGISPFELITIGIAASLLMEPKPESRERGFGWTDGIAAAAILIPSSSFSWSVVAIYAACVALRPGARQRAGACLFAGLAVCALWTSVAAKWFSMAFTTLDAILVQKVLAILQDNIEQADNIVGRGDEFSIVIILTCATAYALPNLIVFLAAIAYGRGSVELRKLSRNILLFSVTFAAANVGRLTLMASSEAMYEFAHGPIGANIFDTFQIASVLLLSGGVHRE
jgi:hypothetical protein